MKKILLIYPLLFLSLFISSCESLKTARFDHYSYQKSTEIKVEAANLMDNAVNPFKEHTEEVKDLLSEVDKIIEYEKNKPYNDISLELWKILSDEERNLLAGFLKSWEEEEQLSEVFVEEAKSQIMKAFDLIIKYEANKNKDSKNELMRLIGNY